MTLVTGPLGSGCSTLLLVAGGRLSFHAPGPAVMRITLTVAGRRLLKAARHIRLTSICVFTPHGAAGVRASSVFQLAR